MRDVKKQYTMFYTEYCKKRHEMWKHDMKMMQIHKRLLRTGKNMEVTKSGVIKCSKMLQAKWLLPKKELERKFTKLDFEEGGKLINAAVKKNGYERRLIL